MNRKWLRQRTSTMRLRNRLASSVSSVIAALMVLTASSLALATDVQVLVYAKDDPADEVAELLSKVVDGAVIRRRLSQVFLHQ